jgi:anti-anti-sigma factor
MTEYQLVRTGQTSTLALPEKLTAALIPVLQPALKQELEAGMKELVFDLARTVSLDSSGIGLLIATSNSLGAIQGSIKLVNVSPDILKLLGSMRLVDRLHASAPKE